MPKGVYERKPWMGNYPGVEQRRRSMIRRHAQGATLAEIARRFNLTEEEVQHVVYPRGVRAEVVKRKYTMLTRNARPRSRERAVKCAA